MAATPSTATSVSSARFGITLMLLVLLVWAFAWIGNALPAPWSGDVPLSGPGIQRREAVRANVIAPQGDWRPCVALLGDSRVAFNLSGAVIDSALPDGCPSQNYGFPALGTVHAVDLAAAIVNGPRAAGDRPQRLRMAVLSVSEPGLLAVARLPAADPWRVDYGRRWESRLTNALWERTEWLQLGHHRLTIFLRERANMTIPPRVWTWHAGRKAWRYRGLESRTLVTLPRYETEAFAMARSYFENRRLSPHAGASIDEAIAGLRPLAQQIVLLIPPVQARFATIAELISPDLRQTVRETILAAGRRAGVPVIDCSSPAACGIRPEGFADPVHLNEAGADAYSQALGARLARLLPLPAAD